MFSRKKIIAVTLASVQLAGSFSFGAYEAAAQVVRAPAGRAPVGGISLVPSTASGSLTPLMQAPGMPQASLAPALAPTFMPAPSLALTPAAIVAAPVAAKPVAAQLTAIIPDIKRDAPYENASQAGAESFAKLYPEKLIEGKGSIDDAVPTYGSSFTRPLAAASKSEDPGKINPVPAPEAPTPVKSFWKKPAVKAALALAAVGAVAAAIPLLSPYAAVVAAAGSVVLSAIGIPQIVKNYRAPEAMKDLAIAGPLIWFAAAGLLSVVSIGSGSSFWWNAANIAGAVEAGIILAQINRHKQDPKEKRATMLTVGAVIALVPLVALHAFMPLSSWLTASFATAMGLLAVLNWPQIRRNDAIFRTEGRGPRGIAPLYPALVVGGSLLHLYAALAAGDVRWAVNSGFGILTTSLVLAQIYAPRAAHALLGPVVRLLERLMPAKSARSDAASRPMRILITGPPGAGKSTYGKMLARDFGMVHISVGELLRERAAADPNLKALMEKGELVDSALVRGVVLERLAQPDVLARGFILDGFPRRPEEIGVIEDWREAGGTLDGVVHLNAPDAELLRRIEARGRMDDSPEVFRRRMEIYRQQTQPVLDHFGKSVKVVEADAAGPDIETTYQGVKDLFERLRAAR